MFGIFLWTDGIGYYNISKDLKEQKKANSRDRWSTWVKWDTEVLLVSLT